MAGYGTMLHNSLWVILHANTLALLHVVDLSPLEISKGIHIYRIYFNFFPLILSQSTLLLNNDSKGEFSIVATAGIE